MPFGMPAPPGGSVVDQSLLRRAADRGVTICFADLDGAEGLWVPEERTVLVNRGLSEAKAAAVIEHELAHVMIDDQHADLDAGKDVLAGHPPTRAWRPETVALAAAVALVAVVGGVMYGINAARGHDAKFERVAPTNGPGLTASESADARFPPPNVTPSRGPDGTVSLSATPGTPTPTPAATPSATASATATKVPPPAPRTTVPVPTPTTSSAPAPPPTTDPPQATTPANPPTPIPTSPAAPTGGAGNTGDQGGGGGSDPPPGPTQPATVANAPIDSIEVTSSDFAPVASTVESPADNPAEDRVDGSTSR